MENLKKKKCYTSSLDVMHRRNQSRLGRDVTTAFREDEGKVIETSDWKEG